MKIIPIGLAAHYAKRVQSRAFCLKMTRVDGSVLRFTTAQIEVRVGSETYSPGYGLDLTTTSGTLGLNVDDLQATGPIAGEINSSLVTEVDLYAGRWDFARFEIFAASYSSPDLGVEQIMSGVLGKVSSARGAFTAELRDLMQFYQQSVGEVSSPTCRIAKLGDARCKVELGSYTFPASITKVISPTEFEASALALSAGYFDFGELLFTSGANVDIKCEVKRYEVGAVRLHFSPPQPIAVNDAFVIVAGCDRTVESCKNKFFNMVNYVGEPHKPVNSQLTKRPPR
jgi:uncharacterized phage protein (TIGR02218 family)